MPDASIDLELNAKQMYSELKVAERKYSESMERLNAFTGKTGNSVEGLTVKTRAAGRQIHNFARDMASGADAATLLQDGLMGVGKSLGLSLGSIAALGIGAVIVGKVHEMAKERDRQTDSASDWRRFSTTQGSRGSSYQGIGRIGKTSG